VTDGLIIVDRQPIGADAMGRDTGDWNRFVDDHPAGCWWHREEWLDYCLAYDSKAHDRSFAILKTGTQALRGRQSREVLAICPAIERDGVICMGDDPCAGPLSISDTHVQSEIVSAMKMRLAGLDCAWRWNRYPSYRAEGLINSLVRGNGLMRSSWQTAIVSLNRPHRWKAIRKSYRSLIHKAQRECDLEWGTSYWPYYEACHRQTATRPRSDATYRHQEQWVNDGFAQVFVAFPKDRMPDCPLAASLVIEYKGHGYYASGPSMQSNIQHALQWLAIESLTKRGLDTYELGWINRHGEDDSIGFFKRGFGGFLWTVDMVKGSMAI
jgi:hypothetical protein